MRHGSGRTRGVGKNLGAICIAMLLVGATATSAVQANPVAVASGECETWVEVPLQGPSCRLPNGLWRVRLSDGGTIVTHGRDAVAPTHGFWQPPAWDPVDPACIDDPESEFHGLVIYARPTDRPNRYPTMAPEIRNMVRYANGLLDLEASELGADLAYRMRCDGDGAVTVAVVNLRTAAAASTFSSVVSDIGAAGYGSSRAKYWVWVDFPYNAGGFGHIAGDEKPAPWNTNNLGPKYAVSWGARLAEGAHNLMMHESGHNLGAVQGLSPNSSGGFHCNDGQDVMCYADGAGKSAYSENACPTWMHFDCGHDDYFHPDPAPGSYLATHWNVASPVNRFVEGCQYDSGTLAAPAVAPTEGVNVATIAIEPACVARRFAVSGTMELLGIVVQGGPPDLDVCWYGGTAQIRCDTAGTYATGTVPAGTTEARVALASGINTTYVLSII